MLFSLYVPTLSLLLELVASWATSTMSCFSSPLLVHNMKWAIERPLLLLAVITELELTELCQEERVNQMQKQVLRDFKLVRP